eukprot:TRINITY_DN5688_c0_g1_i2.p1 TRINITY_DN5688_c0_g1~~TRINITY_DN5688_c0_g1_i2.p1  ORF type:complete len:170 (+),score=9.61 TRINITY_DN5688_c0_g1_i2:110-619(+)
MQRRSAHGSTSYRGDGQSPDLDISFDVSPWETDFIKPPQQKVKAPSQTKISHQRHKSSSELPTRSKSTHNLAESPPPKPQKTLKPTSGVPISTKKRLFLATAKANVIVQTQAGYLAQEELSPTHLPSLPIPHLCRRLPPYVNTVRSSGRFFLKKPTFGSVGLGSLCSFR